MDRAWRRKDRNGFAFLELIIVAAIILFIFSRYAKTYFKKPLINKETEKALSEQGIDTTNYKAIIDTTKSKMQAIQEQQDRLLESISNK